MHDFFQEDYDIMLTLQNKAQGYRGKLEWETMGQRRIYPEIPRTNRAIYFEAAPLLYTEMTIAMQTCDVLCFSESPNAQDIVPGQGIPRLWRHNPLHGTGQPNARGIQVYASDEMNGDMEPHIFARFQRLFFDAWINFDDYDVEPPLRIDRSGRFDKEDEIRLGATMRQWNMIRNLVSLLSNSPSINRLDVLLSSDMPLGYESGPEPLTKEEEALQDKKEDALMEAIEYRAIEIFLDNNMLTPLETLNNVKYFGLRVEGETKLQSHHAKMIQDLKDKIERNWQLSQAAKKSSNQSSQLPPIGSR